MSTLGAGELLGLLAGYRAGVNHIDLVAKPGEPDCIGALARAEVESASPGPRRAAAASQAALKEVWSAGLVLYRFRPRHQ